MKKTSKHYATFDSRSRRWLLVISLLLSTPALLAFITDHDERSKWEKRELAKSPEFSAIFTINTFFSAAELYINDHIGMAVSFNRLYRQLIYYVFRESPVANISYGKNGFIYLNSHDEDADATLKNICISGTKLRKKSKIQNFLKEIQSHFVQRGYHVAFGIAVSKPAIYPENLPDEIPPELVEKCLTYSQGYNVLNNLHNNIPKDIIFYYPQQELIKQKSTEYFYPKENFHWDGMSAHVFSRGLLSRIGIPVDDENYDKKSLATVTSDLTQIGFSRRISVWHYPYTDYGIQLQRKSPEMIREYYKKAIDFSEYTTENPLSGKTALVISNSFGASTVPHLAPGFKKLYHINTNHLAKQEAPLFYSELVDRIKPDWIIFIFHDGATINAKPLEKMLKHLQTPAKITRTPAHG